MKRSPLSIRFRIVLWFSGIVAVLLAAFSVLIYYNFRQALLSDTDDFLEMKAAGVIEYFDTYWESQKRWGLERGESPETFIQLNSRAFIDIAQRWVNEIPIDSSLADMVIGIYSPDGRLLAASENSGMGLQIDPNTLRLAKNKAALFSTQEAKPGRAIRVGSRSLTVGVVEDGFLVCILQVVKPLTFVYLSLERLRFKLMLFFPFALAVSALTGWLLARFILAPLEHLIVTARMISGENLSQRVHTEEARGEMRDLVDTFNGMLDKLERSFLTQQHLLQDVSHELRTPLTVLKGEIDVALKKSRSPEEYNRVLSRALREIDRLNAMVDSLLLLARLDSGQAGLKMQDIVFAEFVRELAEDLSILAEQKHQAFGFTGTGGGKVSADPVYLRRAIINILENAIKYTPESGRVTVGLADNASAAILTVADTGVGIDAAQLPFVFDRFYRADATRSSKGFGLGLSIASSIVKAHRGTIGIDSSPGTGTIVTVSLPLLTAARG